MAHSPSLNRGGFSRSGGCMRLALAFALISSQALAAVEQVKPETRIKPEKTIDAQSDLQPCQAGEERVVVFPWLLRAPDGSFVQVGSIAIRQRC